ncbi:MAG: hypothetical protein HFE58_12765 [Firmicutes bacterium]|nr:hypothetical protein [Bacillota bacterium]
MKELIQQRLKHISNLDERRMFRKELEDVYTHIVDYNMDMYDKLEKRIYNEIDDPLEKFYIYTTILDRKDIDPISEFFHPILEEETQELFDLSEITEKLNAGEKVILTSIFLKCDALTFQEILKSEKEYKSFIQTDKSKYEVKVTLQQTTRYSGEIEKIYHIFQMNGSQWNTINCPYAYRFADIVLQTDTVIGNDENITEITVDLEEYEKYKVLNHIPVWNIKHITLSDKSFPMPAKDRINFEHIVSIEEEGTENGYMADLGNTDFEYLKRYQNNVVIVSHYEKQNQWSFVKIENNTNLKDRQKFTYEILSNKRELGFAGRFASVKSLVIRTKGEIARLMQCYETAKDLTFKEVEILEQYKKVQQTSDCNHFIDENIRVDRFKKIMLIKFEAHNKEDYLILDKMSFIVSEIQILFPEYHCIGEIV